MAVKNRDNNAAVVSDLSLRGGTLEGGASWARKSEFVSCERTGITIMRTIKTRAAAVRNRFEERGIIMTPFHSPPSVNADRLFYGIGACPPF
jgi:hypothetical protein